LVSKLQSPIFTGITGGPQGPRDDIQSKETAHKSREPLQTKKCTEGGRHASESKTFFTNIKNMLRPLFPLFCFLHQENQKTLFPNRKLVRSKEKRTIKLKIGTQPGLQKAQKTKRERERERER
jgi:hypothetical protein